MRLPEDPRRRTELGVALIFLSPLAGGVMTVFALTLIDRFAPGGVTPGWFLTANLVDALLGTVGATAGAMMLPGSYWFRIGVATGVAVIAYLGMFLWFVAAYYVMHDLLGIGPRI